MKFFCWEPDVLTKTISYQIIPHEITDRKIPSNLLHTNIANREDLFLNLDSLDLSELEQEKDFQGILEKLNKGNFEFLEKEKNSKMEFDPVNLEFLKARIFSIRKFLVVLEKYLENNEKGTIDLDAFNKIEMIINDFLRILGDEKVLESIEKDFKQNQLIGTLTNLLKLQVAITEKINEKNL